MPRTDTRMIARHTRQNGRVSRATWMSHAVGVFVDELAGLGLTVSNEHAEAVVAGQLRIVSSTMGISELTTRK